MNAIALNSGALNTTRTIGPAVAGVLIAAVGVAGAYYVQAALFLLATVWTIQIRLPEAREQERRQRGQEGSLLQGVGEGLSYVRKNTTVLTLLALALVPIILAQPYSSMIPVFARDVFDVGAVGQGVLLAVPGAGAVLGALLIAGVSGTGRKTRYLIGGVLTMGVALVGFALSPGMGAALAALLIVGGASTSYRAVNQTLLQTNTEDAYRGRVMSIYLLDRGLAPLGSLLVGTLAHFWGARDAVAIMGVLTAIFAIAVALRMPSLRDMD
jgi:predicted MFS family arabinose efflux permease